MKDKDKLLSEWKAEMKRLNITPDLQKLYIEEREFQHIIEMAKINKRSD